MQDINHGQTDAHKATDTTGTQIMRQEVIGKKPKIAQANAYLHDALVLSQILLALQQERVLHTVRTAHRQFARPLLGLDHAQRGHEGGDADL